MLTDLIRPDIREMQAYVVADVPPDCIKLDAMELPYQFPADIKQQLATELSHAPINYYPNPATCGLPEALREAFSIPDEARVVLGNGSDELIQLITMLLAKPDACMLALEPSFVMYRHNAALFGMDYVGVPLNEDFSMNLEAVLAAIQEHQPALVFVSYPNNPTGVGFGRTQVEAIIDAAPGVVVVDEAYGSFSTDSFLSQAGKQEKLVVMRTLSKVGFAGLRIGYASGHPALMDELAKIVPPYNMNQLSLVAAKFALSHLDWIEEHVQILKKERSWLQQEFGRFAGVTVYPSEANFITLRVPDAIYLYEALKNDNILVKKLHGSHPLLNECLRITVGTPGQNDRVLRVMKALYTK